ncbi:MAG: hypothetical protein NVSMB9_15190 [Isosphaeraceae bacterium]
MQRGLTFVGIVLKGSNTSLLELKGNETGHGSQQKPKQLGEVWIVAHNHEIRITSRFKPVPDRLGRSFGSKDLGNLDSLRETKPFRKNLGGAMSADEGTRDD